MKNALATAFFSLLLIFCAFMPDPKTAHAAEDFCAKAQSTADLLDCNNRRLRHVEAQLNKIYIRTRQTVVDDEETEILRLAETAWITFRDTHCAWEKDWMRGSTLDRIYSLDCKADMTLQRIEQLENSLSERKSATRSFSKTPLWKNVLLNDYPDTFWRSGSVLEGDFNCTHLTDNAVLGLRLGETDDKQKTAQLVLGIAPSPRTGRPNVHYIMLPDNLCTHDITMDIISYPEMAMSAQTGDDPATDSQTETAIETVSETVPACTQAIQIQDPVCSQSLIIYWDQDELHYRIKDNNTQ